jgi:ABC-type transport system involved in multi-copper enzyme maturation permease subunit
MIWLTRRQFRIQALIALGALGLLAIAIIVTGLHLHDLYRAGGLAACESHHDCSQTAQSAFEQTDHALHTWLDVLVTVIPGVTGVFWGAPLIARELETGTFRLAWTQTVARGRWLFVKLGVVGAAAILVSLLVTLMVGWWAGPLDTVAMNRFATFEQRDLVPLGYAAFAFVLGATAGALTRRTIPAMATTLLTFVAARLAVAHILRPNLMASASRAIALNPTSTGYGSSGTIFSTGQSTLQPPPPSIPNAWITSTRIVDNAGHPLTSNVLASTCPALGRNAAGTPHSAGRAPAAAANYLHDCVAKIGATYHQVVAYQPSSHYWPLQIFETVIFLTASLVLASVCNAAVCHGAAHRSTRRHAPGRTRAIRATAR